MIIWSKKNGFYYEDESNGNRYALLEMTSYKGECTSDIIAIWEEDHNTFINYVYGAAYLYENLDELDKTIKLYVDRYNKKGLKTKANYPLTKSGVNAWCCDVVDDILDRGITGDFIISHCNRQIKLPDLAEIYEMFTRFLNEALEEAIEC
jgi:hypothetical protein